jgi:hypothetical protein
MNTPVSNKLAALGLALVINSVIMGSVALMFSARMPETAMPTMTDRVDKTASQADAA